MSLLSRVGRILDLDPEICSGCDPRLASFSKADLEAEMRQYVDRVPAINMPPPRKETTCRIAPIMLEQAHLKEALQQQLTTEERGLVDGDAQANSGNRVNLEVLKYIKEEPTRLIRRK